MRITCKLQSNLSPNYYSFLDLVLFISENVKRNFCWWMVIEQNIDQPICVYVHELYSSYMCVRMCVVVFFFLFILPGICTHWLLFHFFYKQYSHAHFVPYFCSLRQTKKKANKINKQNNPLLFTFCVYGIKALLVADHSCPTSTGIKRVRGFGKSTLSHVYLGFVRFTAI